MTYRLIQDDCLNAMKMLSEEGVKVDAIITDIPYGTTNCPWDAVIPFKEMWEGINSVKKETTPVLLCTYNPQMVSYKGPKRTNKIGKGKLGSLIDSGNKTPKEYKDTGLRYPLQIVQFKRDILTTHLHPTQKPVALLEWLVKTYTNEGDTVLDFTMGSGTTGVACKKLNRDFIGIELDKSYFEIAEKRINEESTE